MRVVVRNVARFALVALLLGAAPAAAASGNSVTVTNGGAPGWTRFDDQGNGLDVHDGEIKQFSYINKVNGQTKYYLYGTAYGCGYVRGHGQGNDTRPITPFCGFAAYESTDLRHWKYDGQLFDPNDKTTTDWQKICDSATPSCYRPHVVYDFKSGYYRLWVNTYEVASDGAQHGYHVLKSLSPTGPFVEDTDTSGHPILPTLAFPTGGDFDVFQDSDRSGYIVYTVRRDDLGAAYGYKLVVEKLSPDYTTGTGVYTGLDTRHTEAPSLFRRGNDYYMTMSDPYCAYCAGTGTAYLRASSPLGPWRGVGGQAAPTAQQMYVDSLSGLFSGGTPAQQRRMADLRDYDVTLRARPLPSTTSGRHDARVGWMFRARDTRNGYLWILSNRRTAKAPTRLYHEIIRNGKVVKVRVTSVHARLSTTSTNVIRTRVVGARIRTWLNGKLVDTTFDRTFRRGFTGVRETPGYSAYFDDVSVSRTTGDRRAYLSDHFAAGSLANFPALNTYRRHGVKISDTSCGGQPDDVSMLRAPNAAGWEYLYQSDRWDHGDQNEAQAAQYWEPLAFNADGSIRALMCGATFKTVLTNATAASPSLDTGPNGADGFVLMQDISAGLVRGQTFKVSGDANLQSLRLTLFQGDDTAGNAPNADLSVAIYDYDADRTLSGQPLVPPATVSRDSIGWAPRMITIPMSAPLAGNTDGSPHTYALVVRTTSTSGVYGAARSDGTADTYLDGQGLVGTVDRSFAVTNWRSEESNDLRFALVMATSN